MGDWTSVHIRASELGGGRAGGTGPVCIPGPQSWEEGGMGGLDQCAYQGLRAGRREGWEDWTSVHTRASELGGRRDGRTGPVCIPGP